MIIEKPLMIGGEHLVTLPVIEALVKKHPDVHLLHFDAHTDLRDTYNNEKLSHATVIRRCWDILWGWSNLSVWDWFGNEARV